jgi:hypothetical protein
MNWKAIGLFGAAVAGIAVTTSVIYKMMEDVDLEDLFDPDEYDSDALYDEPDDEPNDDGDNLHNDYSFRSFIEEILNYIKEGDFDSATAMLSDYFQRVCRRIPDGVFYRLRALISYGRLKSGDLGDDSYSTLLGLAKRDVQCALSLIYNEDIRRQLLKLKDAIWSML